MIFTFSIVTGIFNPQVFLYCFRVLSYRFCCESSTNITGMLSINNYKTKIIKNSIEINIFVILHSVSASKLLRFYQSLHTMRSAKGMGTVIWQALLNFTNSVSLLLSQSVSQSVSQLGRVAQWVKAMQLEWEGSQFKPHQMLCWAQEPNLIRRLLVTFRSNL